MTKFLAGIFCGIIIGTTGLVQGQAIIGGAGYLIGWSVTYRGQIICDDPWIWNGVREIECE